MQLSTRKWWKKSMQLSMLERAYKELKSYEIEFILKTIFGEKEEAC